MSVHKVAPGECLFSIAKTYGFTNWKKIWLAPENAELRKKRPNPGVLLPGDEIHIPDPGKRSMSLATAHAYQFQVRDPWCQLRLHLRGHDGKPLALKRYRLIVDGHRFPDHHTDRGGLLDQRIPADAKAGELTVWMDDEGDEGPRMRWPLRLGYLDPIQGVSDLEAISGVRARLRNLGFLCEQDGSWTEGDRIALLSFQHKMKLELTGEINEETRAALEKEHRC